MIKLLERNQIDDLLWNDCVENACNSRICGYTWYLDLVSPKWKGLVLDNYKAVLPLPVKSKFKIQYLLQPLFTKTLSIYSPKELEAQQINSFVANIPDSIKLIDINLDLNEDTSYDNYIITPKNFQVLSLKKHYNEIADSFHPSVSRNIKKAIKNELRIIYNISLNEVVDSFKINVGVKLKSIKSKDYSMLFKLMKKILETDKGFTMGVVDSNGVLVATTFFVKNKNVISFFNGSSNVHGKSMGAMYLLFDTVIKSYSGKQYIFDFEGSAIKSISDFNKKFGAKDSIYLQIKKNKLPFLVKKISGKV